MSKVLCIYPVDLSTEFLKPIYDALCCYEYVTGIQGDSTDDEFYEKLISGLVNSDTIIFLGHGCSKCLYGSRLNVLIDDKDISTLRNKKLLILACRSVEFIERYNLKKAYGFGFIPTSIDDIRNEKVFHNISINQYSNKELKMIKESIVRIWIRALKHSNFLDIRRFVNKIEFFTNVEISSILTQNRADGVDFRGVADILYYVKEDMDYFE